MPHNISILKVSLLIMSLVYVTSPYLISQSRTQLYNQSCSSLNRSQFFSSIQDYQYNQHLVNGTKQLYKVNKDQIFRATFSADFRRVYLQLTKDSGSFVLNFVFLYAGMVIMLIIVPIVLTCICCPCCLCKTKACTSQGCNCIYNGFVIFFSLLIISICIYLFFLSISFRQVYADMKCSTAIVIDDLINGNFDEQQDLYFSGIQTWQKNFHLLFLYFQQFVKTGQSLKATSNSEMQMALEKGEQIREELNNIPNGDGGQLQLAYKYPLLSNNQQKKIESIYKDNLNIFIEAIDQTTLEMIQILQGINSSVYSLTQNQEQFSNNYKQAQKNLKQSLNQVQQLDSNVQKTFNIVQQEGILTLIQIILYTLLGVLVLLGLLRIFTACCDISSGTNNKKCSIVCCVFFWIFGVLAFVVAFFLSVGFPAYFFSCQVFNEKIKDENTFKDYFSQFFPNNKVVDAMASCFSNDTQSAIQYLSNPEMDKVFDDIDTLLLNITDFQQSDKDFDKMLSSDNINLVNSINAQIYSSNIDITDSDALAQFNKISEPSQYSCLASNFVNDSWLYNPSLQKDFTKCKTNGNIINNQTCPSIAAFQSSQEECSGCIFTVQILLYYFNTSRSVKDGLDQRYSGCGNGQTSFNTQLSNLWTNYYEVKINKMNQVKQRAIIANSSIDQFIDTIKNNISPLINQANNQFQDQKFQKLISKQQGLRAGRSCALIGEDIMNTHRIVCSKGVYYTLVLQIMITILCFAILFNICCIGCAGCKKVNEYEQTVKRIELQTQRVYSDRQFIPYYNKNSERKVQIRF